MARCGCSGTTCSCLVVAGDNITVTGTGSVANPYIVSTPGSAVEELSTDTIEMSVDGAGTADDPYVISADVKLDPSPDQLITVTSEGLLVDCQTIQDNCEFVVVSPDVDNQLVLQPNGLYVAPNTSTAMVADCGLIGDGSAISPLAANVASWDFADCADQDLNATNVYCSPSSGQLQGPPAKSAAVYSNNGNFIPPGAPAQVPNVDTVVTNATLDIPNPSECYPAVALIVWEADVTFQPAANTQVEMTMNSDGMIQFKQAGGAVDQIAFQQARGVIQAVIAPGATFPFSSPIGIVENAGGGSTYNRVQWRVNAIVVNV